jgi:hypothetical protein
LEDDPLLAVKGQGRSAFLRGEATGVWMIGRGDILVLGHFFINVILSIRLIRTCTLLTGDAVDVTIGIFCAFSAAHGMKVNANGQVKQPSFHFSDPFYLLY